MNPKLGKASNVRRLAVTKNLRTNWLSKRTPAARKNTQNMTQAMMRKRQKLIEVEMKITRMMKQQMKRATKIFMKKVMVTNQKTRKAQTTKQMRKMTKKTIKMQNI